VTPKTAPTRAASAPSAPAERNREQTQQRILGAVGEVLARDGFGGVGVNAIAKEAGVDKVLIYRYFGGLPELLRAWGDSGRFWPSVDELLQAEPGLLQQPAAERYARFFEHFIDALRARPLTLEILAAEIHERNELTAVLEAEREAWGEEASAVLGGHDFQAQPHLQGLTVLLVAGIQYLLIRARRLQTFGAIDLRSDAGWLTLKTALRTMATQTRPAQPSPARSTGRPPRARSAKPKTPP
jgi:AcrR family transcriptional regulator